MPSSEAAASKNRRSSNVTRRSSELEGSRKKRRKSRVSSKKTRESSMETVSAVNMSTFDSTMTTGGDCQEDDTTTGSGEGPPRLSKVVARLPERMKKCKIPETFFKVVIIRMDILTPKEHDVVFSSTMVVRGIGKNSPFICHLVVGDQILEINDHIPMVPDDVLRLMKKARSAKFRIIRPWNVKHVGMDRKPATRNMDCSYHVVEVHKDVGDKNGFEMKKQMGKAVVSVLDPASRGGHAFFNGDRIIDVEAEPTPRGILKDNATLMTLGTTVYEDDEDGKGKKKGKKKKRRSTCNESKNEVSRVPSDVKSSTILQTVAKRGEGFANFMSRYLK